MIKYGKYMTRVGISAGKIAIEVGDSGEQTRFKFRGSVEAEVDLADHLINMKTAGADAEADGDPLGLPKQYVKAYELLQKKTQCGMLLDAFQAARDAVHDLLD